MQNLNVITTIQEVYEKEVKSSNITNINPKMSIEDAVVIEREYEEQVKEKYRRGDISLQEYDFKETKFVTRLDINSDIEGEDKVVCTDLPDLKGECPEVGEYIVNVMVTKTEYYGGSVTIKYLTEEEKEQKISEIEQQFLDRYYYSDYDIENELQYLDKCEVDVDLMKDDYYDDVTEIVCDDYESEFGDESLEERREVIYAYIVSKKENYIKKVVQNPKMTPYAEYIFETENTLILLDSKRAFDMLNKNFSNILFIQADNSEEGFFKIVFDKFF